MKKRMVPFVEFFEFGVCTWDIPFFGFPRGKVSKKKIFPVVSSSNIRPKPRMKRNKGSKRGFSFFKKFIEIL